MNLSLHNAVEEVSATERNQIGVIVIRGTVSNRRSAWREGSENGFPLTPNLPDSEPGGRWEDCILKNRTDLIVNSYAFSVFVGSSVMTIEPQERV